MTTKGVAMHPQLYTVAQASRVLGLGRTKIYELIGTQQLSSIKIGASRRIPHAALEEFIARISGSSLAQDHGAAGNVTGQDVR